MATTYTIGEALNLVSGQINRRLEEANAAYVANIAVNIIWNKYDWRETIAELPPFYLVPQVQDYGPPAVIVPSNFKGLREAYLVRMAGDPSERQELRVRRDIRLTNVEDVPKIIGYEPSTRKFRIYPRFPLGFGATDYLIDGTYKIRPTKITPDVLQTTEIPWDDNYFQTFVAALKWAAWDAAGDQRAGQVVEEGGQKRFTGQLGVMHDLIDQMAADEGLNLGDPSIAPSEPLVGGYGYDFNASGLVIL